MKGNSVIFRGTQGKFCITCNIIVLTQHMTCRLHNMGAHLQSFQLWSQEISHGKEKTAFLTYTLIVQTEESFQQLTEQKKKGQ